MSEQIKSGTEILNDFFNEITSIPEVDQTISNSLKTLYFEDNLTEITLENKLHEIQVKSLNDKN